MNPSKAFKNAVLRLYKQGIYTVDYAMIQAEALRSRNRITEADYEELITYLISEQEKEMTAIEEVNSEEVDDTNVADNEESLSEEDEGSFVEENTEESEVAE